MAVAEAELGVLAAATAPALSAVGLVAWDKTWRGSSFVLNLGKCTIASTWFVVVAIATQGPASFVARWAAHTTELGWLVLSAMLGIVIGDCCWLAALRKLGAQRVILVGALKPFVAAGMGFVFLKESLNITSVFALVLTMVGVVTAAWPRIDAATGPEVHKPASGESSIELKVATAAGAGSDPPASAADDPLVEHAMEDVQLLDAEAGSSAEGQASMKERRHLLSAGLLQGYALAAADMLFDVYGAVVTKTHGGAFTSLDINAARFGSATLMLVLVVPCTILTRLLWRRLHPHNHAPEAPLVPEWMQLPAMTHQEWALMLLGILLVTFSAPILGTWALFRIPLAVWNGLSALGPVWAVPIAYAFTREPIRKWSALGAMLAAGGAAMLSITR